MLSELFKQFNSNSHERQQAQIAQVGLENYLSSQIESAK